MDKTEGDTAFCGISDFAQDSLGDIVLWNIQKIWKVKNLPKAM